MKPLNTQRSTCIKQSANCIVVEDILPFIGNCENESLSKTLQYIDEYLAQISESLNVEKIDLKCLLSKQDACTPINFEAFLQLLVDKICELQGVTKDSQQKVDEICEKLMSCRISINMCEDVHVRDMVLYDPNGDPKNSVLHYIFYHLCQIWQQIHTINENIGSINTQISELWAFVNNLSNSIPAFVSYTLSACERLGITTDIQITNTIQQNNFLVGLYNKLCCFANILGADMREECSISFAPVCSIFCEASSYTGTNATTIKDALTQIQQFITTACCLFNQINTGIDNLTNQTSTSFNTLAANTACHTNGNGELFAGDAYMYRYNGVDYQYFVQLDAQYIPSSATINTVKLIYNSWGTPSVLTLYNGGPVTGVSDFNSSSRYLYFNLSLNTPGYDWTDSINDAYIEVIYTENISYTDFSGSVVTVPCTRKRTCPIYLVYQKFGFANISRVINQ